MAEPPLHGCTVCTASDRAAALVLAESFLAYHPDGTFTVLAADADAHSPSFSTGNLIELTIDGLRFGSLDPREQLPTEPALRCLAVRPWLLSTLLDAGRSPCVLIDPNGLVTRSLSRFAIVATHTGAALTARVLEPVLPAEPAVECNLEVLQRGVVEPGLLTIADVPGGRDLLRWWKSSGLRGAAERRLLDMALGFGHPIVRDAGLGLSRWNIHERPLSRDSRGLACGDSPLRVALFDGLTTIDPMDGLLQQLVDEHEHLLREMERRL